MSKAAVIINNKAKNHANVKSYLDTFNDKGLAYDLYYIPPEELSLTIEKCITNYKIILAGGGDGTIRTAAQYCINTDVILGLLPLGTLNHLSKELGLPQNAEELLECLQKNQTVRIDAGMVNGLVFLNNSSIGFYPQFADKRDIYTEKYNKWLSYIPSTILSLKKLRVLSFIVKSKGLNLPLMTSFLMISNNLYSYEFPVTLKRESFHKAQLGLYFLKRGKLSLIKVIKHLFTNDSQFEINASNFPIEIHFTDKKEITIALDGDTQKVQTPLIFKTLPNALTLLSMSS